MGIGEDTQALQIGEIRRWGSARLADEIGKARR